MVDKKTYNQRIEDGVKKTLENELAKAEAKQGEANASPNSGGKITWKPEGEIAAIRSLLAFYTDPTFNSEFRLPYAVKSICIEFGQEDLDLFSLLENNSEASQFFIRNARDFKYMPNFGKAVITALKSAELNHFLYSLGHFLGISEFNEALAIMEEHQMSQLEYETDPTYILDWLDTASRDVFLEALEVAKNLEALAGLIKRVQAAAEEKVINLKKK